MDSSTLASGDSNVTYIPSIINETNKQEAKEDGGQIIMKDNQEKPSQVDDNDVKIKERIAQCRTIIESLKFELSEEKSKLEMNSKVTHNPIPEDMKSVYTYTYDSVSTSQYKEDFKDIPNPYVTCVDAKLNYDENLIEYEKQLQKYQTTLNMAQTEKKNAIRKQMLAKAFKLKLLEVENQCNLELLRVKQSLQCLEPLQMIVNQWKNTVEDNTYDANNFVLMPRYPELRAASGSDVNSVKGDNDNDKKIILDKPESALDTNC